MIGKGNSGSKKLALLFLLAPLLLSPPSPLAEDFSLTMEGAAASPGEKENVEIIFFHVGAQYVGQHL